MNPEGGYTTLQGHDVSHEQMNKPWYDIRGDTKKELLVSSLEILCLLLLILCVRRAADWPLALDFLVAPCI